MMSVVVPWIHTVAAACVLVVVGRLYKWNTVCDWIVENISNHTCNYKFGVFLGAFSDISMYT